MSIRRMVYFRARGNRLCDFINAVRRSDIRCYSQRCIYEEYTGQIYYCDLEKLRILAEEYKTELTVEGYAGKLFGVYRYKKRYGFIAGALAAAAVMCIMNNTIMKIEINGNSRLTDSHILSVLNEEGLRCGIYLSDPDLDRYRDILETRLPGVGWAGVRRSGSRIVVDIHEIDPPPSTLKNNIPCNIIADHDAVIISVRLRNGRCLVNEGDAVSKGDILVSGIISTGDETYRIVHAHGDITGEYEETQRFVQYFESTEKNSYKKTSRKYLEFLWLKIPLSAYESDGTGTQCTQRKERVSVFGREIPLGIIYEDYDCFRYDTVILSSEETEKKLSEQMESYERNFCADKEIVSRKISKKTTDKFMEYEVDYVLRGPVGTEGNLFIRPDPYNKEDPPDEEKISQADR